MNVAMFKSPGILVALKDITSKLEINLRIIIKKRFDSLILPDSKVNENSGGEYDFDKDDSSILLIEIL